MGGIGLRIIVVVALLTAVIPFNTETARAHSWGSQAFDRTWARTDLPVQQGNVNRTWMWGPGGHSAPFYEPYFDAPNQIRLVQYTDKSRMENNAYRAYAPWDVTNGRLAYELITGRMQLGDAQYQQLQPADVQVAGDNHPQSPTYQTFNGVINYDPLPGGSTIIQTINRNGHVSADASLARHGVTARYYVSETDHTVASVFWNFMNSSGQVFENGQYRNARLFENPFFATGFPITEAYWMNVPVGGQWRDVLAQCFERRCLTFTPANPSGWQVEAGNIGQHYYSWRYGTQPAPPQAPGVAQYQEQVQTLVELTEMSREAFYYLLDTANPSYGWYQDFYSVMNLWSAFYPALDSLSPPAGYEHFHERMLDAYWHLAMAAEDLAYAFQVDSIYWFEQGLQHYEVFLFYYFDALNYWSEDDPEIADMLESESVQKDLLDPDHWESFFQQ